jgi:class 3 adenylate cyclase/tetratricopeptide (TPR) repeat protein
VLTCPACKASLSPGARFCKKCGTAIAAALGQPAAATSKKPSESPIRVADAPASENLEGERKTVTALFADIKGSTELEQDLDPEEARAIVDPALKLMIEAVQRYDGYVVQSTGDGIFALFGAPVAHEDHPQRALYAALRMQEDLKRYSARLRETGDLPLEARVGVNTGEVVIRSITTGEGHTEYTPIGHTTNLASRMQALAPTGSIAISEQTRRFVEGYFQLKPLGPTKVKGVTDPVNVYEVTSLGPLRSRLERAAGRGLSKFVGRQAEMASLKRAAEQAKAGRGQIAAAIAEAGVGKSRLFFEFKAENQSGWMVLQAFSVSHGKASAYLPVIDLLHGYFGIDRDNDDSRQRREKVNGKLLTLDRSLEDVLPYLHALLGLSDENNPLAQMDAQVRKRRTLEAIKRILVRESLNQPLIVIFEDLHWIDEETQGLLNLLADSIGSAKILLLVNYRPEYHHEWGSKTCYSQLRLDPLATESAEEMLTALVGDDAEVRPLKRLIIERTEGNPFFMEETVLVLLDDGALKRDGAAVRLIKPFSELKIPPTVQAILAARIDRLPPDEKDLLQTLAVTGKEFSLSLVREVIKQPDDEINRVLNDLQLAEFIYEQPTGGDIAYSFKHALTQEVAYTSVLAERRRALHVRIGVALEALYTERLDDRVEQLAYHFTRGGNAQKALEYLERAGHRAEERSANLEAVSHFSAALELLRATPHSPQRAERELALLLALGPPINVTKGWDSPEVEGVYGRARELCQETGETPQLLPALFGLAGFYIIRGEYNSAREFMEQNLTLARRTEDPGVLLEAHHYLGAMQTYAGELASALQSQDEVITRYDPKTHHALIHLYAGDDPAACCLGHKAWTLWLLGYPDQALQTARAALRLAQQLSHPFSLAQATWHNAWLHGVRGERAHAIAHAQAAIALSEEQGFSLFARSARFTESALAPDRATTEGVERIRRSLVPGAMLSVCLGALAQACLEGFHFHEAGEALAEAFPIVDKGERIWEAELFRLRGELKSADPVEAEVDFRRALKVARSQNARSLELRTTMSLARLLNRQGKRDEARAMLAEIYGWFTEGFDTADLKDAKALLDELSA